MSNSPEKLLIEAYRELDRVREILEQVINQLGQKNNSYENLPEDIQRLVDVAVNLTPAQRENLMRFLNSLKDQEQS